MLIHLFFKVCLQNTELRNVIWVGVGASDQSRAHLAVILQVKDTLGVKDWDPEVLGSVEHWGPSVVVPLPPMLSLLLQSGVLGGEGKCGVESLLRSNHWYDHLQAAVSITSRYAGMQGIAPFLQGSIGKVKNFLVKA